MKRHTCWNSNVMVLVLALLASIGLTPAWAQSTSDVEYYHTDAVGNVRMITDESGTVLERYDYTPFGKLLGGQAPSVAQPRGYAGKERDTDTGFDYFGGRYLQTEVSRFTTPDPVLDAEGAMADPQRWNRYAYVRNNPLRYTDPDGRALDVVLDVGFLLYDVYDIGRSLVRGEGVSKTQVLAAGADLGSIFVPFATGAGPAIRAASKVDDVVDAARGTQKLLPVLSRSTMLENATSAYNNGVVTNIGRAVQKHADGAARSGFFPKLPNAKAYAAYGEQFLKTLLDDPRKTIKTYTHPDKFYGDVVEITGRDGGGVIFRRDGTFIGLREP